ncbi:hypothetical protein D3OALGA1CA_3395 [Olavius algarvensis associated proteobacterium Delta 3]|nr:hypothetical protein D3OALGB2SA_3328 [Olavius algarvensis associated proteobacterium Delta 3]CAB5133703.1 hypothetical protein D3OALGA1CA_3395 [Olavius algarvensis associated proteobacterium Delta 3]
MNAEAPVPSPYPFPKRFRVMTMNLRFGLAEDGPNSWENRKQSVGSLFDQRNPDFVGFQEANDFQIDFLASVFPGYGMIGQRLPAPTFWQNNVIFYRSDWTCRRNMHFFLSLTPTVPSRSPDSRWPRQCTMGLFESGDARVICINTHLDFDPAVQVDSARMILRHLSEFPPELPGILVGDFNAGPESAVHGVFSGGNPTGPPGAERVFKNGFAPDYPGTYHGFTGVPDGRHIDWIMYSGDLEVLSAGAISDPFDNIYPSDHFPLQVDFRSRFSAKSER